MRISALNEDEDEPNKPFSTQLTRTENKYWTYDEWKAGRAKFSCLQAFVMPLEAGCKSWSALMSTSCPIWFEEMKTNRVPTLEQFSCQHTFHKACVQGWIRAQLRVTIVVTCPICHIFGWHGNTSCTLSCALFKTTPWCRWRYLLKECWLFLRSFISQLFEEIEA